MVDGVRTFGAAANLARQTTGVHPANLMNQMAQNPMAALQTNVPVMTQQLGQQAVQMAPQMRNGFGKVKNLFGQAAAPFANARGRYQNFKTGISDAVGQAKGLWQMGREILQNPETLSGLMAQAQGITGQLGQPCQCPETPMMTDPFGGMTMQTPPYWQQSQFMPMQAGPGPGPMPTGVGGQKRKVSKRARV
jgi:hypothetical protein